MIIFAAPSGQVEPSEAIHPNCRISVANFKMESVRAAGPSVLDELAKKRSTDPAAAPCRGDREQQQFCLVCDHALKRKADYLLGNR